MLQLSPHGEIASPFCNHTPARPPNVNVDICLGRRNKRGERRVFDLTRSRRCAFARALLRERERFCSKPRLLEKVVRRTWISAAAAATIGVVSAGPAWPQENQPDQAPQAQSMQEDRDAPRDPKT